MSVDNAGLIESPSPTSHRREIRLVDRPSKGWVGRGLRGGGVVPLALGLARWPQRASLLVSSVPPPALLSRSRRLEGSPQYPPEDARKFF